MRRYPVVIALCGVLLLCGFGYPPSPLMEQVDAAWKAGKTSEIPGLIEKRLAEAPKDTTALFLARSYYLMWEGDSEKTAVYRKKLEAIINPIRASITDPEEKRGFEDWLKSEFPPEAGTESSDSDEQKAKMREFLRKEFKDRFPGTIGAQTSTMVLSRYLKGAAESLREDYAGFQKRKVAAIKKVGVSRLVGLTEKLGKGDEHEVPEQSWPDQVRALEPVRVFATPGKLTIWFYRVPGNCDGVILYRGAKPSGESSPDDTHYTDFGEGVVWFNSSR